MFFFCFFSVALILVLNIIEICFLPVGGIVTTLREFSSGFVYNITVK